MRLRFEILFSLRLALSFMMASVSGLLLAITPRPPEASAIQVGPTVREKDGRRYRDEVTCSLYYKSQYDCDLRRWRRNFYATNSAGVVNYDASLVIYDARSINYDTNFL